MVNGKWFSLIHTVITASKHLSIRINYGFKTMKKVKSSSGQIRAEIAFQAIPGMELGLPWLYWCSVLLFTLIIESIPSIKSPGYKISLGQQPGIR